MSTELKDFSVINGDSMGNLENIQKEINKCKCQHEALLKEHKLIKDAIESNKAFAEKFQQRSGDKKMSLEDETKKHTEMLEKEQEKRNALQKEQERLQTDIMRIREELEIVEKKHDFLRQKTEVSTAVPEKKVVFKGKTEEGAHCQSFDVNPRIVYPMEGGTALITFEEEGVAQKILSLKEHKVQLGECTINMQAKPIQFLVPINIEMDTQICPHKILVSNLPNKVPEDKLLDKLHIHFAKKKNGGGDVDDIDMLHDSGTVVITFTENNVAKGLSDKLEHRVEFMKNEKSHNVKVTPFLNGEISRLQTRNSICLRTVQLTGIPDIMELETLQDHLEIHFQKATNGGGEVESIIYNPMGHTTLAVFTEDSPEDNQSV